MVILVFALLAFIGIKFTILGAFLAGVYLSNGIAHFSYGFFDFDKITPKRLFGEERIIHSIWGISNFIFSAILVYFSNFEANWFAFIIGFLIAFLLLLQVAKKSYI
ncbi:hypothetical protein METP1_00389 [Methanosarcinales archaeon]|nr:hypothetical protein METP1_00389 [Methanosarcinales archaeon]